MLLESPQAAAKRISARWGKSNMSREMHHLMRWQKLVVDAELVEPVRFVFAPHAGRNHAVAYDAERFEVAYERLQPAGFSNLNIACKNVKHSGLSGCGIASLAAARLLAISWIASNWLEYVRFAAHVSVFFTIKQVIAHALFECRRPLL